METHVIAKRDSDGHAYTGIIVAPNHRTALRLFAMDMLEARESSLEGEAEPSLLEFSHEGYLDENWKAEPGRSCACCSSADVRKMTSFEMAEMGVSPIRHAGRGGICMSCAHTWVDLGPNAEIRAELEREAAERMEKLDEFERASLEGEV